MDVPTNNFKGVMLCNRPNENVMIVKEKPFCSRVQPYDQWGLSKKYEEPKVMPIGPNPVLERHKKWLEEFKLQNQLKKHAKDEQQAREDEKFQRVRELAKKDREVTKKMKEDYKQMNDMIKKELAEEDPKPKTVQLTAENLKKLEEKSSNIGSKKRYKQKPVWAMTKEEEEQHIKEQEDELLNFVENLDYDDYINDLEVNVMLKALQQRVAEIKKQENWQEKVQREAIDQREPDMYDKISQSLSKNDEARSVHSEKTQSIMEFLQDSINQLRKKQEQLEQGKQEWEKSTQNGDPKASLEDRIAKHVADEILHQYKVMYSSTPRIYPMYTLIPLQEKYWKEKLKRHCRKQVFQVQLYPLQRMKRCPEIPIHSLTCIVIQLFDQYKINMEFFEKFIKKEITEEQFISELQTLTTKIQKKSTLTNEQILSINQCIDQIEESCLNQNVELFIKFALYISNRGVYEQLFQVGWNNVTLKIDDPDPNILGLHIIKRVYQSENSKVLIIFLNDILRQQKTVEKKFVLLEVFVQILPKIQKREIHLAVIFPVILMVINEGLQKYLKYRQQVLQNDLNEDNKFTKLYMSNFQKWTVSILKRIFDSIKQFPEIKSQSTAIKELYGIDTIYDYFEHQLSRKPEDAKLVVKHYVLLFLSDLTQGIMEAEQSINDSQLDPEIISQLAVLVNTMVTDIHDNKLEIIENYLIWIKFCSQFDQEIPQQYQHYTNLQPYNPAFVCNLVHQVLTSNNFERILAIDYKLKILIGSLYEQKKLNSIKCDIQSKLLTLIVKYLNERDTSQQIRSASQFITPFDDIILLILEKAGSGLKDEQPYIDSWKKAQASFAPDVWTRIIEQCINKSANYHLLSHMVNNFRAQIGKSNDPQILKYYETMISAIFKKEAGNIDAKILLFHSATLLIHQLNLKQIDCSNIFETKWKSSLKKYEKDIQQSLDYLEARRGQETASQDQAYQAILAQESNIRIAYDNLRQVLK